MRRAVGCSRSCGGAEAVPRLISDDDVDLIVATATTRPEKLGRLFTCWSLPKLSAYLANAVGRSGSGGSGCGRSALPGISFQRTRTWTESADPDKDIKLDHIEYVTTHYPDRCFALATVKAERSADAR